MESEVEEHVEPALLYFDSCCWGRPWDEKDEANIVAEAEAVEKIVDQRRTNLGG